MFPVVAIMMAHNHMKYQSCTLTCF